MRNALNVVASGTIICACGGKVSLSSTEFRCYYWWQKTIILERYIRCIRSSLVKNMTKKITNDKVSYLAN